MNALYDLRDMIVEQLEDYGKRGELSSSVLEKVDILAHAAKNLDKVIEGCEGESDYSNRKRSYNNFGNSGRSYRRSGRRSRRGRYSGDENNDLMEELYSMMDDEQDEQKRQNLQRLASKMEQM